MTEWHYLTREEAENRRSFGFGGSILIAWLIAAFLVVWQIYGAANDTNGLELMYGSAENAFIMRHVLTLKAILLLPFLVLAPMRHRFTAQIALTCIAAAFVVDFFAINFVIGLPMPKSIGVNAFNLVVAIGFALYFIQSKRFNLTFRLREPVS